LNDNTVIRADSCEPWFRLRVAIFCLVLYLPLAVMLSPSLRTWTDSRKPVFPDWSWRVGDIRRYPSQFEEQFNAALPMRVKVAALSRSFYIDWLGISPIPEAVLGTDGWLYYTGPVSEKLLDRHVRGRDPFSQDELERWRRLLLDRTRHFRSIGAKYVFVIAPNKESIYPEHLPSWIGPRLGPSRVDQLLAYLKSVPEVTVIDLRSSLIADKKAATLYYKTDTHWNTRGAYTAYREIARTLEPDFPGLAVKSWASFNPRVIELQGMDVTTMIGLGRETSDAGFEIDHSACTEPRPVSIPIPKALQSRMTAPAYATRCDAPGNINAVTFHDSFGWALVPFFEESFRSTANFSATEGKNDTVGYDMPEKLKANLVVEIMVERSLSSAAEY
jgi:hypothetical protein